jgi:hypothetical protein
MPDGFSVIGFTALDQFGNLAPERIGNRAAIAADSVGISDTFGAVGKLPIRRRRFCRGCCPRG